jgi:hypothetical protein
MPQKKHEDTSVSLHPLSFEEALKKLTETPSEKPYRPLHRLGSASSGCWWFRIRLGSVFTSFPRCQ